MKISHWPEQERPREKLAQFGAETLSDTELLAILLGHGSAERGVFDLALALQNTFGGLRGILAAPFSEFAHHSGLGLAKFARLHAGVELSRRALQEVLLRQGPIQTAIDVKPFLVASLRKHRQEVFACFFLTQQNQLIAFEELFRGSIANTPVHPRELIKRVLHHNAAAVILAHNHPSGDPKPSVADQQITALLKRHLEAVETRVLDHLIVGETTVYSMMGECLF